MRVLQGFDEENKIVWAFRDRTFHSAMVRSVCDRTYGSRISKEAWKNWRDWADVPISRRVYTFEQFCFLYAIALIRSDEDNRYRQLREKNIRKIADSLETQQLLSDFIKFFDQDLIVGKDAPIMLASRGVKVSIKTLYKNVPGFSTGKIYQVDQLKFWAIA